MTLARSLTLRVGFLVLLFATELIAFSLAFDPAIALEHVHGFAQLVGSALSIAVRGVVLFSFAGLLFGTWTLGDALPELIGGIKSSAVSIRLLSVHAVCVLLLAFSASHLLAKDAANRDFLAAQTLAIGIPLVFSAVLAVIPPQFCLALLRAGRDTLIYAGLVTAGALLVEQVWKLWWLPLTDLTFVAVKSCLALLGLQTVAIPTPPDFVLGTSSFQVEVARSCSGIEGISLMLAFGTAWLWFFRRECRFPQALLLLPLGVITIWCTNVVRITALILIGHAGWPNVAIGGFHSQAGWIAFVCTAVAFSLIFQKIPWIRKDDLPTAKTVAGAQNNTAAYLVPFLSILAAGILGQAFSAGFDWLYPLRVIVAAGALFAYRRTLLSLNWRVTWVGAAAGIVVFILWLGCERLWPSTGAAAPPEGSTFWLLIRILGSVITVPISEELAFRGYLLRRLQAEDFESVDFRKWTYTALLISSLVFGSLHGNRWLAGTLAGLVYAGVLLRRGAIGDAVLAHGTTNALLAAWVLTTHEWQLW